VNGFRGVDAFGFDKSNNEIRYATRVKKLYARKTRGKQAARVFDWVLRQFKKLKK